MNRSNQHRIVAILMAVGTLALMGTGTNDARPDLAQPATPPSPDAPKEISLRLQGMQAKQLNKVFSTPVGTVGYPGEVKTRPLKCGALADGQTGALNPSDTAIDFSITHAPLTTGGVTQLCVFSVMIGEAGVAAGAIVPAKSVPEVEDSEPVYEVQAGWAIVGGTWPAAKGRRSRAGAPGTQFAIEIDGDTERYYLLNTSPGHSVTIRVDGQADILLDSNNDFVEVTPTSAGASTSLSSKGSVTSDAARQTFRDKAAAAALRCGLPGRDPLFMAELDKLRLKAEGPNEKKVDAPGAKSGGGPGGTK